MKVLAVKQPWASLIAEGKKTIEVRSRPTNIKERVAIYASRSNVDEWGLALNCVALDKDYPRGYIIGTVDIIDSKEYIRGRDFIADKDKHLNPCEYIDPDCPMVQKYGWIMENVLKLETPIPFKMPRGCGVWANADIEGLE